MRAVFDASPNRYRAYYSNSMPARSGNPYRRTIYSPGFTSPVRAASLSPKTTPSPKRKARSSSSTSLFTSFVRALKINPKKRAPKLGSPINLNAAASLSPKRNSHGKRGLNRVRSFPAPANWDLDTPQGLGRRHTSSPGDRMDVDDEQDGGYFDSAQVLEYNAAEDPFATPPLTPVTPLLSKGLNGVGTPDSSPDSVRSRKRRAAERSRMKTLQLLGPEARMAVGERFGDSKRAWEV